MDDTFAAQYKNPLWQKKRLEAMEWAGFECQNCGSEEKQLHVHHRRYVKGRKVWEYDNSELDVLCNECHEMLHNQKERLQRILFGQTDIKDVLFLVAGFIDAQNYEEFPEKTDHIHPLYLASFLALKLANTSNDFIVALVNGVYQLERNWEEARLQKNDGSEGAENNGKD